MSTHRSRKTRCAGRSMSCPTTFPLRLATFLPVGTSRSRPSIPPPVEIPAAASSLSQQCSKMDSIWCATDRSARTAQARAPASASVTALPAVLVEAVAGGAPIAGAEPPVLTGIGAPIAGVQPPVLTEMRGSGAKRTGAASSEATCISAAELPCETKKRGVTTVVGRWSCSKTVDREVMKREVGFK